MTVGEIAAVKSVSCLARRKIIKIKIVIHMEQNNQNKIYILSGLRAELKLVTSYYTTTTTF